MARNFGLLVAPGSAVPTPAMMASVAKLGSGLQPAMPVPVVAARTTSRGFGLLPPGIGEMKFPAADALVQPALAGVAESSISGQDETLKSHNSSQGRWLVAAPTPDLC